MGSAITLQELHDFHSIDRQLYSRLILNLRLDFNLARQVFAFWYWLERKGYRSFIKIMLQLSDRLLYGFAMEAKTCLLFLGSDQSFRNSVDLNLRFPLMRSLVDENFNVVHLCQDREESLNLISGYVKNFSERIFSDITPRNLSPVMFYGFPGQSCAASYAQQVPIVMPIQVQSQSLPNSMAYLQPFVANEAQKVQTWTANEPKVAASVPNGGEAPSMAANGAPSTHNATKLQTLSRREENGAQNPLAERTMFITFSKGHSSITEDELRDLFTRKYGNCVENIYLKAEMLFARVIVKSARTVEKILGDKERVELKVDGKDVWLRRFVERQHDIYQQQATSSRSRGRLM